MEVQPIQPVAERTFREVFCEEFDCLPEKFEERLFLETVRPQTLPFIKLLWSFKPQIFDADIEMLSRLGKVTSSRVLKYELESYRHYNPPRGWIRKNFKMRASGQRLLKLAARLFRHEDTRRFRLAKAQRNSPPNAPAAPAAPAA